MIPGLPRISQSCCILKWGGIHFQCPRLRKAKWQYRGPSSRILSTCQLLFLSIVDQLHMDFSQVDLRIKDEENTVAYMGYSLSSWIVALEILDQSKFRIYELAESLNCFCNISILVIISVRVRYFCGFLLPWKKNILKEMIWNTIIWMKTWLLPFDSGMDYKFELCSFSEAIIVSETLLLQRP